MGKQIEIEDQIKLYKEIKKNLVGLKTALWNMEEVVLLEYLKLQNCDSKSNLKEKVYYCSRRHMEEGNLQVKHKELSNQNNLLEFSNISHTAVYLKSKLAQTELKLGKYFTSKLLDYGLEIFSNPDFIKSVMAEGCGIDFTDPTKIFSLKQYQDFGDRESCTAMHLVGGASLPAFVSYFARNVVLTPGVLPASLFCVGRHYRPVTSAHTGDLVTCQQSQALQMFSVSTSYHQMEQQLDRFLDIIINLFSVFPNFSVIQESAKDYETCNSRQFRLEMKGVDAVSVGNIGVQGKYFSDRMMMVSQDSSPLFTVSCNINLTKMIAVLVELSQDPSGNVNIDKISQWLQ